MTDKPISTTSDTLKGLLTSRKFWAMVIGLIIVLMQVFLPNFKMDGEAAAGFVAIIVSYIFAVSVNPGPIDPGASGWERSLLANLFTKEFFGAVVGLAVVIMDGFGVLLPAGITTEQIVEIFVLISAWILGNGGAKFVKTNFLQ